MAIKIIKVKREAAADAKIPDTRTTSKIESTPPQEKKDLFGKKKEVTPTTLPKMFPFPPAKDAPKADAPPPIKAAVVGDFKVLPTFDFSEEAGKKKFLVHRHKLGVWLEVISFDEYMTTKGGESLKLRGQYGKIFGAAPDPTIEKNYILVSAPADMNLTPDAMKQAQQAMVAPTS